MDKFVFISNLDNSATEESVKDGLRGLFPAIFINSNFDVKIYKKEDSIKNMKKTVAILSGVLVDVNKLNSLVICNELKLSGRQPIFKPDNGAPRNSDGTHECVWSGAETRANAILCGQTPRKITSVFDREFIKIIKSQLGDIHKRELYVKGPLTSDKKKALAIPSYLMNIQRVSDLVFRVQYTSILGAMQAACYHAEELCDKFGNKKNLQSFTDRCGLSKCLDNDGVINLHTFQITGGFVPFDVLHESLINLDGISGDLRPQCWRCKARYVLLGIDIDLGYVAGRCCCSYTESSNRREAYAWIRDDKRFTRLSAGILAGEEYTTLAIWHEPARQYYDNIQDYRQIMLPLLEQNWEDCSTMFLESYKTSGAIENATLIESGQTSAYYAIDAVVPCTNKWNERAAHSIKKVSVQLTFKIGDSFVQDYCQGDVMILKQRGAEIFVGIRIRCKLGMIPFSKSLVNIFPQPDKSFHLFINSTLDRIVEEYLNRPWIKRDMFFNLFVLPNTNEVEVGHDWEFLWKPHQFKLEFRDYKRMKTVKELLNNEQKIALEKALKYAISFIQGPPGTGKTLLVAALVSCLAIEEGGIILMVAPSNEACDVMASRAGALFKDVGFGPPIVRMFAKSREYSAPPSNNANAYDDEYQVLHILAQADPNWRLPELTDIFTRMENDEGHKLTSNERKKLLDHVLEIQLRHLRRFKVIVCTTTAMTDGRIAALLTTREISTVIIEEAGQMSQPDILCLYGVHPIRIVFVGDHLQLPPLILSKSAERSGLNRSQLEWSCPFQPEANKKSEILPPWSTLKEQFRMEPEIRKLVSDFAYNGKLRDGASIASRSCPLPDKFKEIFPIPIYFHDINGTEKLSNDGVSYENMSEVTAISKRISLLLMLNVKPADILVLTFYDGQRQLILRQLRKNHINDIRVDNVDACQGQECAIVILSLVRSNSRSNVGFTASINRLNVAMSRAKFNLMVYGNWNTFNTQESAVCQKFVAGFLRYKSIHNQ